MVTWATEVVDSGGDVGRVPALAIDSTAVHHIVYADTTNGAIKYAYGEAGSWSFETVDTVDPGGATWQSNRKCAIDIDSSDVPHVAYYDSVNGRLKYAKRTGGAWQVTDILDSGHIARSGLDLRVSPNNNYPAIAYYQASGALGVIYRCKWIEWNGSAWTSPVDVSSYNWGENPRIGFRPTIQAGESEQRPYVVYIWTGNTAGFAVRTNAVWAWYSVPDGSSARMVDINWDDSDVCWILFDWSNSLYRVRYTDAWQSKETLYTDTNCIHSSMVLYSGLRRLVWSEIPTTQSTLMYMAENATGWDAAETVDTIVGVGYRFLWPSHALDPWGRSRIAYYDEHNANLKFAYDTAALAERPRIWIAAALGRMHGHQGPLGVG